MKNTEKSPTIIFFILASNIFYSLNYKWRRLTCRPELSLIDSSETPNSFP